MMKVKNKDVDLTDNNILYKKIIYKMLKKKMIKIHCLFFPHIPQYL